MRELQNRFVLIVYKDLDTEEIRVSIASGIEDEDTRIRIAGPKFEMSNVEPILVEDIEVSKLLKDIKRVQVKRESEEYELELTGGN